jgi:hypothetical protein
MRALLQLHPEPGDDCLQILDRVGLCWRWKLELRMQLLELVPQNVTP